MAGDLYDAPNQQAVRPDGSGPGVATVQAAGPAPVAPPAVGPVERSLEAAEPQPRHTRRGE
jgi:hypothetical protein